MFELVFLGTSASAPSIHRGLPSLAVLAGENRYLIDCGEGTQRQILRSGIGFKRLNRILLTHAHLDHILGLGGLISTFANFESVDYVEIYGGKSALDRVDSLLFSVVLRGERTPMPIKLVELKPGRIFGARAHEVVAFPVQHRGPGCYGYEFREAPHRPFLAERAVELGVPTGPERGMLVRGQSITLASGRTVSPDDVLGPEVRGSKLVVIADVGRTDTIIDQCRDADALVIEATFMEEHAEEARAFGHLTARQAAELAVAAGAKSLILWHVSRRYRERDILAEARALFPEAVVARDFDHFMIKRGEGALKLTPVHSHEEDAQ